MTKQEFKSALYEQVRQKLGRPEGANISNNFLSQVISVYVSDKKVNKPSDIIEHLENIKGAKNIADLLTNIINDAQAGTRSDRTEFITDGIEW